MITELKERYGEFSDSILENISYGVEIDNESSSIELCIRCFDLVKNTYGKVRINMLEVTEFVFIERSKFGNNTVIKEVLIKEDDGFFIFDFCPIDHFDYLEENPDSKFKIKCKNINFLSQFDI